MTGVDVLTFWFSPGQVHARGFQLQVPFCGSLVPSPAGRAGTAAAGAGLGAARAHGAVSAPFPSLWARQGYRW